jgi:hypothetical protein
MFAKYYRFMSKAAWYDFAKQQGWQKSPEGDVMVEGATVDVIGPAMSAASIVDGELVPSETKDPRFHINILWERDPPEEISDYEISPETPTRVWSLPAPVPATPTAVPQEVEAWAGLVVLRRHNMLLSVETAIKQIGGEAEIIFNRSSRWGRDSALMKSLSEQMGVSDELIDQMFREAEALRS